jgi:hypothetical protein
LEVRQYDGSSTFESSTANNVKGAIDTGRSFSLDYVTTLKGCKACDATDFTNLKVDGKAYAQSKLDSSTQYFMEVQPDSGFVTKVQKVTTTYMVLDKEVLLPFYSLNMTKTLVPIYDMTETTTIDQTKLNSKFDFVPSTNSQSKGVTIGFWVTAAIMIVAGIGAHVMYMQKKRRAGPAGGYQGQTDLIE